MENASTLNTQNAWIFFLKCLLFPFVLRRDALLPLPLGLFSSAEVERLVGVAQVLLEGAFTLGCPVCCRLQDWGFRVVKCCSAFLAFQCGWFLNEVLLQVENKVDARTKD